MSISRSDKETVNSGCFVKNSCNADACVEGNSETDFVPRQKAAAIANIRSQRNLNHRALFRHQCAAGSFGGHLRIYTSIHQIYRPLGAHLHLFRFFHLDDESLRDSARDCPSDKLTNVTNQMAELYFHKIATCIELRNIS